MKRPKSEKEILDDQPIDKIDKNLRHIFGLLVEKDWKTASSLIKMMKEGPEESKQLGQGFEQLLDFLKDFSAGKELKAAMKYPDSIIVREDLRFLLPDLPDDEYEALKKDIEERGIIAPLVVQETPDGLLLVDGYTRYHIAEELGMKRLPVVSVTPLLDPKALAILLNVKRRHLTKEQRNDFIKNLPIPRVGRPKRGEEVISRANLAKELGVSERTIQRKRNPKKETNVSFSTKLPSPKKPKDKSKETPVDEKSWVNLKDLEFFDKLGYIKGIGFALDFTKDQVDLDYLVRNVDKGMQALLKAIKQAGLESQVDHYRMVVSFEARKKDIKL